MPILTSCDRYAQEAKHHKHWCQTQISRYRHQNGLVTVPHIYYFPVIVRKVVLVTLLISFCGLPLGLLLALDTPSARDDAPLLIAPARSSGSGLLLEPDLDLSWFSRDDFIALTSKVGSNRINKQWTSPVVALPAHSRSGVHGLTHQEVKDYMKQARTLFNDGQAVPMSDVGLISTQEDVIRKPMLNHISAFSNDVARVYLLVQKQSTETNWGFFSIVQDMTLDPPVDYFADLNRAEPSFQGNSCYKCHSSGPLAIHPVREDLVIDPKLAAAISQHIKKQPLSTYYWPTNKVKPDYGEPLALDFCTKCHDTDGVRQPLYKVHSHPIRILVDYGYMPPKKKLTPTQIAELRAWLDAKPESPTTKTP